MSDKLYQSALDYHRLPKPGKFEITPTKPLATQRDLALAYSPGVAAPCEEIAKDPSKVADYTARSNMVAVVTNGTAVLGLGDIGPLASKPVMEGKAVLFKKFAGIDAVDIEIDEKNPEKLVDIIASLEPTFGAFNLEDIKAPECFYVENELKKRMKTPVFHDDQHGTAIIVCAAVLNALSLVGKKIEDVTLVCSGAGAAAIACLDLLQDMGLSRENIIVSDAEGVIYKERPGLKSETKKAYAIEDRGLYKIEDALKGADIFLGVSIGNILEGAAIEKMADSPLILALANPTPEIDPKLVKKHRPDAIVATGRSDHPNQVNNVLCFPFIFRGALDVGATAINQEMKLACVQAIANLAKAEASDIVASAYVGQDLNFGPEYIIPKPFDPRLILEIAPAVAQAAMDTGVATRPIEDFESYRHQLSSFVFRSGMVTRPLFERARKDPKKIVYAEGEDERILRAIQVVVDEGLARPIVIGRPEVVTYRIKSLGLRLEQGRDFELVDPQDDPRYKAYWQGYHQLMERRGVSPALAKLVIRTNATVIAAMMVQRGEADGMIAGPVERFDHHVNSVLPILGLKPGVRVAAAMSALVLNEGPFFFCDPFLNKDPTASEIAEMTILAAEQVRQFGIQPKVGLLSHSNFGAAVSESSSKMSHAREIINQLAPELEVEGEMQADTALDPEIRERVFPGATLSGPANLLVMPNLDAANIAYNIIKSLGDGHVIGPMMLGLDKVAHIVTSAVKTRSIVDITAIAVCDVHSRTISGNNIVHAPMGEGALNGVVPGVSINGI